ncbi:MAG: TIGR03943 family protein [Candidatus Altiarchaeota archaeon]|nr:TIGR03943 family protein [Candidatus Altiarchaeota archaeon]
MKSTRILNACLMFSYASIVVYMLYTGRINYYLHSRFNPFLYLAAFLLFVFSVFTLSYNAPDKESVRWHYAILLLPLASLFFFSPESAQNNLAAVRGIQVSSSQALFEDGLELTQSPMMPSVESVGGVINVSDDGFRDFVDGIYAEYYRFSNKRVRISGILYKVASGDDNQAVLARPYIWCCLADARLVGVLVYSHNLSSLTEFNWYEVNGVVILGETPSGSIPLIYVQNITAIETPHVKYINP